MGILEITYCSIVFHFFFAPALLGPVLHKNSPVAPFHQVSPCGCLVARLRQSADSPARLPTAFAQICTGHLAFQAEGSAPFFAVGNAQQAGQPSKASFLTLICHCALPVSSGPWRGLRAIALPTFPGFRIPGHCMRVLLLRRLCALVRAIANAGTGHHRDPCPTTALCWGMLGRARREACTRVATNVSSTT